jgi:putative hydrolase of the HAD superfamily
MKKLTKQIKQIIFDADDTLWENNIFYIQASNDFIDLIQQAGFSREAVESDFDTLELKVVKEMGYGSGNFVYILEELFKKYNLITNNKLDNARFQTIIQRFTKHPVSKPCLFDQVVETLQYLKQNYELYILTKGEYIEQKGKIERAGIINIVNDYFIPHEKNDKTYRELLSKFNWKPEETCMVGNSPKSDINPALRNGMYAIFIPYQNTWKLDNEPINSIDGKLIVLDRFSELKAVF